MSRRTLTVDRYKEIERLLAAGRGIREITRALKCSRRLVRQIRDGQQRSPEQPKSVVDPLWMAQVDWPGVIHDLGLGHPLKFLWEEKAQGLTDLPGFFGPLLIGDGLAPGSVVDGFIGLPAARSHGPSGPGEAPGSGADCNSWRLNSRGVSCPRLECGRTSLN